jgi:type I restriction-modification system DNA methylase subunit
MMHVCGAPREKKRPMIDQYGIVQQLTSESLPISDQIRYLSDFATELGWEPSDQLLLPAADDFATAHLIVEHGLQNTALISFLRHPGQYPALTFYQQRVLLNASYNNLVDWHISVDSSGVSYVYNRSKPPRFHEVRDQISRSDVSRLNSGEFEKIANSRPSANIPDLDSALIGTISLWKRRLAAEIADLDNESLSALFNGIIFVRAVEDFRRRNSHSGQDTEEYRRILRGAYDNRREVTLKAEITAALEELEIDEIPESLVNENSLSVFDSLSLETRSELFGDFYRNRYAQYYEFDFSLMSKHALSRIYEHYVSILREPTSTQPALFPLLPEEVVERSYGNVYTPEFVARFFAKYLRQQYSTGAFQDLRIADPACGSGIFLRTVLELQHDQKTNENLRQTERDSSDFSNVLGVDIDANACHAARLSLSLLALSYGRDVPQNLEIVQSETLAYFTSRPELFEGFDAVVANPPFVNVEGQNEALKETIASVLEQAGKGRTDLYLAILRISLEMIEPGGFGLFVLPQNFLISDNAAGMRKLLKESAWIRCLADLTAVRVFEDVGVYVILLIFQKKLPAISSPNAIILRCQDLVGQALQDVLESRPAESPDYSIYEVAQDVFELPRWQILPPRSASLQKRLSRFARLDQIAELKQGMITGADTVFILSRDKVPDGEEEVYAPFLRDRDMEPFKAPKRTRWMVFYPYVDGVLLTERLLKKEFPKTWRYLMSHRPSLEARRPVTTKGVPWWRPSWPRTPENLFKPKLITPHLVITPRFSLDAKGTLAVSHSPLVFARFQGATEPDVLKYILAVLNSSIGFWHISQHSHSYSRGYSRLEKNTLAITPIPAPTDVDISIMRQLLRLVDVRLDATGPEAFDAERQIDRLVAEIYQLSLQEKELIGMEPHS